MLIQAINNTGGTLTYSGENLTIPGNSTVTIPLSQINNLLFDGNALNDINLGNLSIGDGVNAYGPGSGVQFLTLACQLYNQSDKTGSGTINALNGAVTANVNSISSIVFNVTGTWSAVLTFEAQNGDGTWFTVQAQSPITGNVFSAIAQNAQAIVTCGGYAQVRVRCSSYTSGTATVSFNASSATNSVNQGVAASLPSAWPMKLTESTGTNTANIDSRGAQYVVPLDGVRATYSATSAIAFASATSATDIFTITGSGTKTVRVLRIGFSLQVTTAGVINVLLVKRSAANSGGTSATSTNVPHDSTDAAGTATVKNYTANPSGLGSAVGTVRGARIFPITSGSDVYTTWQEFEFGNLPEKAVVLRGTSEVLAINLNATTVTGGTWTCYVEWTEE